MNNDESILAELRKMSAWTDMSRKATKWMLIFFAVFIPAFTVFAVLVEQHRSKTQEDAKALEKHDWYDVDRNIRTCDFDLAIRIGEELIKKSPQYPEGHYRLAGAYLAEGKIKEARVHYAEAFRLLPCEGYEKLLIAIDKRIKEENPRKVAPANAASPRN